MSRNKRRGDNTAPALFPFLAVLLCTIGALVLILVLTVANSHASAKREAETAMTGVNETTELIEVVSAELEAQRQELKSRVERRRRDLADIEDHITRLSKTLDQLVAKAGRIQSEASGTEADRTGKSVEVGELRKEIDQKKREIIEEIEKQKKRKPAFAVIPYVGANGTSRRPVYLECTKEGVVVQPEGLLISLNDLKPPFGPGNPLDAALRVLRLAYQQKDATFGITLPPYPLLIVRPDGIQTYAVAREAMSGWDDQFGYELVDKELELTFPQSPAGLKEQLVSTVEMAKRRQQALIASMPRRVAARDRDENWDAIDMANSTQLSDGVGTSIENTSKSGVGTGVLDGNATQQTWQLVQGMANSQVSNAIQKNGMSATQNVAMPALTGNTFRSIGSDITAGSYNSDASSTVFNGPGNSQDSEGTSGPQKGTSTSQGESSQSDATSGNGTTASSSSSSTNLPPPPRANAFSSGTAAGGGASSLSASGSPAQSPTDPNAAPNISVSINQKAEGQVAKAKHVRSEGDLKPISVSAGHGWAASRAEGKATPVSRSIRIVALKDKWLMRSDVNPKVFEVNVTMDEGPQQAGNQLAIAMRKRVDSWGLSVPGGYWSPMLTIEAANDAQQSVARLERLLEGSGVEIKVVPLTLTNSR
ncbi:MAG TPA: hypothetical protein VM260_10715 [Pirellula sp.]|nr:hypothetical protein [Pirellula sp.]